ncbi:MAG: T9SS type A sorting domain-containing protein [Bacteroidales bacterium]|nr:T9SS type A sorting domain-containing protein [Bacteroidales bacterium]MCF8389358.1 T9SS type A sorting domain-containing protein [Bacteroidales bacterium]
MKRIFLAGILFIILFVRTEAQSYTGDIATYISSYISSIPGSSGNDYDKPEAGELITWQELMVQLLNDDLSAARQKADILNYTIVEFEDNSVDPHAFYYVVEEKSARQHYWGTYIINRYPLRSQLVIQSPHPVYDSNTGLQGIFCFKNLGAKAFFVSGTHRCNHSEFSVCSGTTTACNSSTTAYQISDNAHNAASVFERLTEVLSLSQPNTYFVQLHGFAKGDTDPYLIMSNGTRITPNPDYTAILRDELFKIDNSLTFKIAHIDLSWTRLIATTNVQGRFLNQSPSPCTQNAAMCSGRFIHIEQEKSKLRQDFIGWLKMYEALSYTFPETPLPNSTSSDLRSDKVFLYPNPTEGLLTIKSTGPFKVSIFNICGKSVYQADFEEDIAEIDLSNQESGIYLVKIVSNESAKTIRIVLK